MAKKCTKKRKARAKFFFCQSFAVPRRRCKNSLLLWSRKFCYHGNVTSHFSSLSVFPIRSQENLILCLLIGRIWGLWHDPLWENRDGIAASLQNFAFFRLAKTKPKRAKDARAETHSKEHPPRVFLWSPEKKRKNNLVLQASVVRQVLPKRRSEFGSARTWRRSQVLAFLYIT